MCHFTDYIYYLDHVIKPEKPEVTNNTEVDNRKLRVPATVTELRSFLELCNEFRQFLSSFARIASPSLNNLCTSKPNKTRSFTEEELSALKMGEKKLISPQVLTLPKSNRQTTLNTDANERQVSCVLL